MVDLGGERRQNEEVIRSEEQPCEWVDLSKHAGESLVRRWAVPVPGCFQQLRGMLGTSSAEY